MTHAYRRTFGEEREHSLQNHLTAVCEKFDQFLENIFSLSRWGDLSSARSEICFRLVIIDGWSLTEVGTKFGRHHTTILYGVREYAKAHLPCRSQASLDEIRLAYWGAGLGALKLRPVTCPMCEGLGKVAA